MVHVRTSVAVASGSELGANQTAVNVAAPGANIPIESAPIFAQCQQQQQHVNQMLFPKKKRAKKVKYLIGEEFDAALHRICDLEHSSAAIRIDLIFIGLFFLICIFLKCCIYLFANIAVESQSTHTSWLHVKLYNNNNNVLVIKQKKNLPKIETLSYTGSCQQSPRCEQGAFRSSAL